MKKTFLSGDFIYHYIINEIIIQPLGRMKNVITNVFGNADTRFLGEDIKILACDFKFLTANEKFMLIISEHSLNGKRLPLMPFHRQNDENIVFGNCAQTTKRFILHNAQIEVVYQKPFPQTFKSP